MTLSARVTHLYRPQDEHGLRRSIATLVLRQLLAETNAGLAVTDEGRHAVGAPLPVSEVPAAMQAARPVKKIVLVTDLLRRAEGATLAELVAATGWLPHTTRAALTGLRKKGHSIAKATRDGATTYLIASAA